MLSRPCVISCGSVDGPTHTLERIEGGDLLEPNMNESL